MYVQVPQSDKKAGKMKHAAILPQSDHPVRLQTVAVVSNDGVCFSWREICPTVLLDFRQCKLRLLAPCLNEI